MSERVTFALLEGRPVAIKRARDDAERDRLAREAAVLRSIDHPGIVRLVEHRGDELVTAWVGTQALATAPPGTLEQVAVLVARVAATLADLHDRGIAHGRVDAGHVVFGPDGAPVLCGLADALIGDSHDDEFRSAAAEDVRAVGELLRDLLDRTATEAPAAESSVFAREWRRRSDAGRRHALEALAAHAGNEAPARRPTARALAAAVMAANAGDDADQHHAERRRAQPRASRRPPVRHLRLIAGGGAGAVALVVAGALTMGASGGEARTPESPPASPASSTSVPVTSRPPTPRLTFPSSGPTPEVEVDGWRYRLGGPGDLAAVADWDCDGRPSAALLRPSTGQVFHFDRWATGSTDVAASLVTTVAGARSLAADPEGAACPGLVVERMSGEAVPVAVEP